MIEYIVHTADGRHISYHDDTPEDAVRRAEYAHHTVVGVQTNEEYEAELERDYEQRKLNAELDKAASELWAS